MEFESVMIELDVGVVDMRDAEDITNSGQGLVAMSKTRWPVCYHSSE